MKKIILLVLSFSIAFALAIPKNSKYDKRINHINFNSQNVTLIKSAVGYVTMLQFALDERSVNVVTGFSDGWEIVTRENYVFIKAKSYPVKQQEQELVDANGKKIKLSSFVHPSSEPQNWKTNLIITTNKRIYSFDLELVNEQEHFNYQVNFKYPLEEKERMDREKLQLEIAQAQAAAREQKQKEEEKVAKELERKTIPRNYDFMMHINENSESIAPNFAYDDGVFTYLGFDNTKAMPSVFLYDEANGEVIANTHIEKYAEYEVIVIHQIANQILLRSGNRLVGIKNNSYGINPLDRTYTTKSKKVIRTLKNGN